MRGVFSNANDIHLILMIFPRMSLHSKLVPVQYRDYEYYLFSNVSPKAGTVTVKLSSLHCIRIENFIIGHIRILGIGLELACN